MAELLYNLLLAAAWAPVGYSLQHAGKGKKGKPARASVTLGLTALLLSALLGFVWVCFLKDLFTEGGQSGGAGVLSLALMACLFLAPFAIMALVAVAGGLVMAVVALCYKRRKDLPEAVLGLFLNLGVLAAVCCMLYG